MREQTVKIYTVVVTAADVDQGLFQSPTEYGSYLSPGRALQEMNERIRQERENLSDLYDREERTETTWEAYTDGEAAAHFVRVEILTSLLHLLPADNVLPKKRSRVVSSAESQGSSGGPAVA